MTLFFVSRRSRCAAHIAETHSLILRRRNARGAFEQAVEVELTHAGLFRQSPETELFRHVLRHPIGHPSQLASQSSEEVSPRPASVSTT